MTEHTTKGQRIGYRRTSTIDQNTARQLDGMNFDSEFEDKVSGKDTNRPDLQRMLKHVRRGDTVFCHSMDRLARNLDDLRRIVFDLTSRGVKIEFVKESLTFQGDRKDSSMSKLMLSMIGAFSEFERSLILERQREGIAIAKAAGKYKGRKAKLTTEQAAELRQRAASEPKSKLAREYGVSRETLYTYLNA